MQVICLEDKAFYALVDEVVSHVLARQSQKEERWVTCVSCCTSVIAAFSILVSFLIGVIKASGDEHPQ
jgi:hypothetical protein